MPAWPTSSNLLNLKRLVLLGAPITDAGLAHLRGLEGLEELDLGFTRVGNAGIAQIRRMKFLHELYLAYTSVTDACIDNVKDMQQLRKIDLTATKVTEAGIQRLRRCSTGIRNRVRAEAGRIPWLDPRRSISGLPGPHRAWECLHNPLCRRYPDAEVMRVDLD